MYPAGKKKREKKGDGGRLPKVVFSCGPPKIFDKVVKTHQKLKKKNHIFIRLSEECGTMWQVKPKQ